MAVRTISGLGRRVAYRWYSAQAPGGGVSVVFILAHMRSGSTLLTHLLNSHPEMCGYGETHLRYSRPRHLRDLWCHVHWVLRDVILDEKYVVDKILHRRLLIDERLLRHPQVKVVILVRDAVEAVQSIVEEEIFPGWGVEEASDYYTGRIRDLVRYAETCRENGGAAVVSYEELVEDTERSLDRVSTYLELDERIPSEYSKTRMTGNPLVGDSSEQLKEGRVMSGGRDHDVAIDKKRRENLTTVYSEGLSRIREVIG